VSTPLDISAMSTLLRVLVAVTALMFLVMLAFLAAAARLRGANRRKAERWGRLETRWGDAIEAIADGRVRAEELHAAIQPSERMVFLDFLYKSVVREERPVRRQLCRSLALPYRRGLEERLRTGDAWQRARALRTLADLAGDDAAGIVAGALDDPSPHVALTAARAYAQIGAGTVHPLLDRIERYGEWDRRLLRSLLASFGGGAAPALRARLEDPAAPASVRAVCAEALAASGQTIGSDAAVAVLTGETDIDLVAATLRLLRAPASPVVREAVRALCVSENAVVRGQAVACLARIGEDGDLLFVERALSDESPWVTLSAARGLAARRGQLAAVPVAAVGAVPAGPPKSGPSYARPRLEV
jgi:HEAT repeat protein